MATRFVAGRSTLAVREPVDHRDPLVIDVYDMFVAARAAEGNWTSGTLAAYRSSRANVAVAFDGVRTSMMDAERLHDAQRLLRRRLRPASVRLVIAQVHAAWCWAARNRRRTGVRTPWEAPDRSVSGLARRTPKRPYTPRELEDLLALAAKHGEDWLLPLRLLAETGARVSEVCGLRGAHLVRDEHGRTFASFEKTKSGQPRRVPILPRTACRLPRSEVDARLFLNARGTPLTPGTLRKRVRRLLEEAGLAHTIDPLDQQRQRTWVLDVHSFRRSFITHCSRAGVPKSICMAIVGHELRGVHDSYERNAIGDDLHDVVQRVSDWRRSVVAAGAA